MAEHLENISARRYGVFMRYAALAIFSDGTTREAVTSDEAVWAETTPAAARKWYWKLTAEEQARCTRVAISAYVQTERHPWQAYDGPTVVFAPKEAWRQVAGPIAAHGVVSDGGAVSMPDLEY